MMCGMFCFFSTCNRRELLSCIPQMHTQWCLADRRAKLLGGQTSQAPSPVPSLA